jgi:hypothetical protein
VGSLKPVHVTTQPSSAYVLFCQESSSQFLGSSQPILQKRTWWLYSSIIHNIYMRRKHKQHNLVVQKKHLTDNNLTFTNSSDLNWDQMGREPKAICVRSGTMLLFPNTWHTFQWWTIITVGVINSDLLWHLSHVRLENRVNCN